MRSERIACLAALGGLMVVSCGVAQSPFPRRAAAVPPAVEFLFPEQVTVAANKPTVVKLHFRVGDGLHINSHTPSDEFMIPTTLTLPGGDGVELKSAAFPQGKPFALPIDPATKLSVYTAEFVIDATLKAARGEHLMQAQLRYQACDNAQCMPPKTIPVAIEVIAR